MEEHDRIAPPAIDVAHLAIVDADALPREQVDRADCRILDRNWHGVTVNDHINRSLVQYERFRHRAFRDGI